MNQTTSFAVYCVGGAVRDRLLQLPVHDQDWVVVGATPDDLKQQGFRQVGADFPVFLHPETHEEYALARKEKQTTQGYHGFICDFSPDVSLEDDLLRRDLTINAMAQAQTGELIDPYGGQNDLDKKILRHVSPAFSEDPLRVLRVSRFFARFKPLGFLIAPETFKLMQNMCTLGALNSLKAERVWQETHKALLLAKPSIYFETLQALGLGLPLFPQAIQIQALQQLEALEPNPMIRWGSLFLGLNLSPKELKNMLQQMRIPQEGIQAALIANDINDNILQSPENFKTWCKTHPIYSSKDKTRMVLASLLQITPWKTKIPQLLQLFNALDTVQSQDFLPLSGPELGQAILQAKEAQMIQYLFMS